MRMQSQRISVLQMLRIVAIWAIVMGMFRLHISLGSLVTGLLAVTSIRMREIRRRYDAIATPISHRQTARFRVESALIAMLLLMGAAAVFMVVFFFGIEDRCPNPTFKQDLLRCLMISSIGAFFVCLGLRKRLWTYRLPECPEIPDESPTTPGSGTRRTAGVESPPVTEGPLRSLTLDETNETRHRGDIQGPEALGS